MCPTLNVPAAVRTAGAVPNGSSPSNVRLPGPRQGRAVPSSPMAPPAASRMSSLIPTT